MTGNLRIDYPPNDISLSVSGASLADHTFSDISARTQARMLTGNGFKLAVRATESVDSNQYFVGVASGGGIALERLVDGSWEILDIEWETGLDPLNEDVVMQIDAFGENLNAWVWRAGDPMPSAPLLTAQDSHLAEGSVSFDIADSLVNREVSAVVRYIQVDTKHIPEPCAAVLCLIGLLGMLTLRRRR